MLLPLGIGGTLGTAAITEDATLIAFYTQAFDTLVGSGLANVMIFCVVAALILSMNTRDDGRLESPVRHLAGTG